MIRTPYGRTLDRYQREGEFWAAHGYLFVVQDVRGRFDSEGEFVLLAERGRRRLRRGRVGRRRCRTATGTSARTARRTRAWVQNALAIQRPPHLRAMWVNQGGSNGNVTALRHNGALELRWLTWAVSHGATSRRRRAATPRSPPSCTAHGVDMYEWLRRLPWGEGNSPLARCRATTDWARELYEHGDAGPYWQSIGAQLRAVPRPHRRRAHRLLGRLVRLVHARDHRLYVALAGRICAPATADGSVDARRRCARADVGSGEVDLGPPTRRSPGNLARSRRHLQLRWFDRWLKDVRDGVGDEAPVRLFVMGGGSGERTPEGRLLHGGAWREEPRWPLARAVPTPFYLRRGRRARPGRRRPAARPTRRRSCSTPRTRCRRSPPIRRHSTSSCRCRRASRRCRRRSALIRVMVDPGRRRSAHASGPPRSRTRPTARSRSGRRARVLRSEPLAADMEVTGPIEATIYLFVGRSRTPTSS